MRTTLFFWVGTFILSGCAPLLSPETQHRLSHVLIAPIPERSGQTLRHLLTAEFKSYAHSKRYALKVNLNETSQTLELGADARSNLVHISLTATYELKHILTGKMIDQGQVTAHSSKTLTTSYYSRTTADAYILHNNLLQLKRLLFYKVAKALDHTHLSCRCSPQEDQNKQ